MKIKITLLTIIILITGYFPAPALLRSSTNYGLQTDTSDQGGAKSTSASYIIRQGSAGQLGAVGDSDSTNYSAGQGYIYTTNTRPATPESLAQYKANGTTSIPWPAGWTNTSSEVMKMGISDYDPGDILTPQIEVQLSTEVFTNHPSFEGGSYNYSGSTLTASVTATSMQHAKGYLWQARTKDLENYYSDWKVMGGSPSDYLIDLVPPGSPESLQGWASPETVPTYVYLAWLAASDPDSGVAGYNMYRSLTPGSGYTKESTDLIPDLSTSDATVILGTDYYYVMTAQDNAGSEGIYSNQASAPLMGLTREAVVDAPGGYGGGSHDPVPGATITAKIYYHNKGFARATDISLTDKIPSYTQFELGSATGESITAVQYSSDEGTTWNYVPSGAYVDPAVTNVRWLSTDMSSGQNSQARYGTVIR